MTAPQTSAALVEAVREATLPDVAEFIRRWRIGAAVGQTDMLRADESALSIERRLRWLLIENPVAEAGDPIGYCVRDSDGVVRGVNLAFPGAFRRAGTRIRGLGSGSFFVEPAARSMGFFLFRKYLATPGYSFFFATTCNANSAALWSRLGGCPAADSAIEDILPRRLDVIIPEAMSRHTKIPLARGIGRICGQLLSPVFRFSGRFRTGLTVEPCRDWEKLAELSRRHQPSGEVATDRTPEFLKWRFGASSPMYSSEIFRFCDQQGNEGWFAMGNFLRGERRQFRGSVVLDIVWPREKVEFGSLLHEIERRADGAADAIFLRTPPGLNYRLYCRRVLPYKLASPRVFALARKGSLPFSPASWDYDDSDYGAWRFQWSGAPS